MCVCVCLYLCDTLFHTVKGFNAPDPLPACALL